MSYPQTAASTKTNESSNNTSHVVNLPSVSSGDLLLLICGIDGAPNVTDWDIFSALSETANGTNMKLLVAYRICTGSEGSTSTIVTNDSEQAYWYVYKITGWYGSGAPSIGTAAVQETADLNPDPPSCTAAWGSDDNLWFACGTYNTGSRTITSPPSGFGNLENDTSGTGPGSGCVWAARLEEASGTKDPAVATLSDTNIWVCQTIVIRPAAAASVPIPPLASRQNTVFINPVGRM